MVCRTFLVKHRLEYNGDRWLRQTSLRYEYSMIMGPQYSMAPNGWMPCINCTLPWPTLICDNLMALCTYKMTLFWKYCKLMHCFVSFVAGTCVLLFEIGVRLLLGNWSCISARPVVSVSHVLLWMIRVNRLFRLVHHFPKVFS